MIVVVAGMPRSGSTWLFNAARLLLGLGERTVYSQWIEDFDFGKQADLCLIKIHLPDHALATKADVILCSHRDLRDIVTSMHAMGWCQLDDMVATSNSVRRMHDFWAPRAQLDLPYEVITSYQKQALYTLASALTVRLTDSQADDLIGAIPTKAGEVGTRGHDPTTLLHDNHINDGLAGRWRNSLPDSIADEIRFRHYHWLLDHGYL